MTSPNKERVPWWACGLALCLLGALILFTTNPSELDPIRIVGLVMFLIGYAVFVTAIPVTKK